jgi:hypothetical protein
MSWKKTLVAATLAAGVFAFVAPRTALGEVAVSISVFEERLSPHGRWVTAANYGDVWVPSGVASGWAPYVDGEWVYTDYGWTWISDDPWGDIAYHYGTWAWTPRFGWAWVPGTIWAPAWVTWAYTDDYIGWAPVPPSFGLSFQGYSGRPVVVSQNRYVFVPARQFLGVRVSTVRVPLRQNAVLFQRARKVTRYEVSNGIVRTAGPPPERVEKMVGRPLQRVTIDQATTRPTAFAPAAGGGKAQRVPIVAPERERAAAIAAARQRQPSAGAAQAGHEPSKPQPGEKAERKEPKAPAARSESKPAARASQRSEPVREKGAAPPRERPSQTGKTAASDARERQHHPNPPAAQEQSPERPAARTLEKEKHSAPPQPSSRNEVREKAPQPAPRAAVKPAPKREPPPKKEQPPNKEKEQPPKAND